MHGIDFYPHAELTHTLGRLNEGASHIVVADKRMFIGYSCFLGNTERGINTRIREGNHAIHIGGSFPDQFHPHALAALVHIFAEDDGIRPGEIHQLENALTDRRAPAQGKTLIFQRAVFDDYHFPGSDAAQSFRFQQVKGAAFGGKHPGVAKTAHDQRMKAVRIADGNELSARLNHQTICALHSVAGGQNGFFQTHVLQAVRNKMQKNFAVAGGLENGSGVFQLGPQFRRVGQIAVMRKGKMHAAAHTHGQRLRVARFGLARRGIAHMTDGNVSGQMTQRIFSEDLGHQPHTHMAVYLPVRPCGDARALLTAMLKSIKSEIGQTGRFLMSADAENAAHSTSLKQSIFPARRGRFSERTIVA